MNDYFLSKLARQREKEILEEVRGIRLPRRRHLPRGRDVQERASDREHPESKTKRSSGGWCFTGKAGAWQEELW